MTFIRGAWRFLVGVKDALALLFLLLFFGLIWAALSGRSAARLPAEGALILDLSGTLVDQAREPSPLEFLSGASLPQETQVRDAIRAVRTATTDKRVKALVLDLDSFVGGGQANLQALGREIEAFKKTGKPVYAYATGYLDDGYLLAAHADEIWLNPLGGVLLTGPGGTGPYFGQALERLGVTVNVFRVGTYKSFVEPFTRNDQSPDAKAADQVLVDTLWGVYTREVRAARPRADVPAYVAGLPQQLQAAGGDLAVTARQAGLIDRLGDWNALGKRIQGVVPASEDPTEPGGFAQVDHSRYLAATGDLLPKTGDAIGIVYVSGEIMDGEGQPGTAGGDTIAGLVDEALADDSIKALVIRVDSPGGSVIASERIRLAILGAKEKGLPVVASMGPVAASGGYWVSTAADTIYAEQSTITGSIGVFGIIPTFERTLARLSVGADGVKSTPFSGEPDLLRGIGPETKTVLQMSVEDIYRRFVRLVAQARGTDAATIEKVAQGRVWAGVTAVDLKLVDKMGGLDAAVAEAARRAKLPADTRTVDIEPQPLLPVEILASLMGAEPAEEARDPVAKAAARGRLRIEAAAASAVRAGTSPGVKVLCGECVGQSYSSVPAMSPRVAELLLGAGR